jgi:hypothetical protein
MANNWTEGDLHLMYQVAHHDLWWAKGHLWTAANWALALLAALVGVGGLLLDHRNLSLSQTWPLLVLSAIVALAAIGYLARLHYDIIKARRITTFIREVRPELEAIVNKSLSIRPATPDTRRGLFFVGALIFAVSAGLAISWYVFSRDYCLASASFLGNSLAGVVFLCLAVKKGGAQQG